MVCQHPPRACGKTWLWVPTLGRRGCPVCVRPPPTWCGWSRPTRWVWARPATRPYWHSPRKRVSAACAPLPKDCKLSNLSSAPSGPPVDVTAESSSPDSLQVRWKVGRAANSPLDRYPLKPIPRTLFRCKNYYTTPQSVSLSMEICLLHSISFLESKPIHSPICRRPRTKSFSSWFWTALAIINAVKGNMNIDLLLMIRAVDFSPSTIFVWSRYSLKIYTYICSNREISKTYYWDNVETFYIIT